MENIIKCESYSISEGLDEQGKAVCLIISESSIEAGKETLIKATKAYSVYNNLIIESNESQLVLLNIHTTIKSCLDLKLPIVVIDDNGNDINIVENYD